MSWQNNLRSVSPYIAGEQPELTDMIKLNTNENPYPPSLQVQKVIEDFKSDNLRLYPSTDAKVLRKALATYHHLNTDYPIYCGLYDIPYQKIPLADDFSLSVKSYFQENGGIVIANPNAPTAIAISLQEIEEILQNNQDSIVLIDEAYIDFGGESCLPLLEKFDNLVVVQTFSKSRSLAGIRLGVAFGSAEAIAHLYDVKNSFNSYPIDRLAQKIGEASLNDETYFQKSVSKIITTRENFKKELINLGFQVTDSKTNFVFVHHPKVDATTLFKTLYEAKIIVRHWNQAQISDWLRITIGTDKEMDTVVQFLKEYLKNKEKSY